MGGHRRSRRTLLSLSGEIDIIGKQQRRFAQTRPADYECGRMSSRLVYAILSGYKEAEKLVDPDNSRGSVALVASYAP